MTPRRFDAVIENHLSFYLVRPLTAKARKWLCKHTLGTWYGGALFVEGRYIEDLASGLMNDGLKIY